MQMQVYYISKGSIKPVHNSRKHEIHLEVASMVELTDDDISIPRNRYNFTKLPMVKRGMDGDHIGTMSTNVGISC